MLTIHTVTTTVASRHARPEARYLRHHTGPAPEPMRMLRSWLRIAAEAVGLTLFLAAIILATCLL